MRLGGLEMNLGRPGNETLSLEMKLRWSWNEARTATQPHTIHHIPQSTATDVQQSLIVVKVKLCHIMVKCKSVCTELPNLRKKARHGHTSTENEILVWMDWDPSVSSKKQYTVNDQLNSIMLCCAPLCN